MKSKTIKLLKSSLLLSVICIFVSLIGLFSNVIMQNAQIPTWIILIQIIPLPIFLIILTMTSLDLGKQDDVTIRGKLVEKKVYTVGILMENGKVKKFRAHEAFVKEIKERRLQQEIEIQYYRRTKAVIQIKK
ncbi:hypothetical protein D3P07_24180 [Paenibacillus sp. 1011MAR3C5]|uniref:hypothetical protein n=1 Tax=Paenibacillus sp. 1011MAR3C5 TaxID=1675787 RepID=UPI000E6D217B|nr:hypothetical protein [Paenibacillus sp. 1011MAR3C5]RJE83912.1 hypothetical protein D3P07_24180 [Paenibacillus sp. 1011MAR3C5]